MEAKLAASLGAAVRACRTEHGWSQAVLAERLESSVEYVSLLERGQRLPSVGTLVRLAQLFGVSAGALLGEKRPPDQMLTLINAVPDAARPAVIGMLQGVVQAYRRKRR
ncbi:MAG TPA: helix-turn-helix transcriptional regulator [Polyangiaceae bacterium]